MAKPRTTANFKRTPAKRPTPPRSMNVTASDVARRAYDLYVARGRKHGHDLDDWLQAERELKGSSAQSGA